MSAPSAQPGSGVSTTPLRIKRLTLRDFRAFPGPAPAHFDLDGKNLLVYGENGAGKSSIFHALGGFFTLRPERALREHKNIFSGLADNDCKVAVAFADGSPSLEWTVNSHPGSLRSGPMDGRVTEAALRRACLDYRALLDTNYKQGSGPINLFEIAVEHLLRDFPVTGSGGTFVTIGELWDSVVRSKPSKHTSSALNRINQACVEFNAGFRRAFPPLVSLINELMHLLGWKDVEVKGFNTPGLTYNKAHLKQNRAIDGQTLEPELSFRSYLLQTPQLFLNEARLSALGLAMYLAGRLACTPTATTAALKLLVLDDVLIGLDHSNRLPVLDVLNSKFSDWQIVLLTHDRVWFEMARFYMGNTGDWKFLEVFEGEDFVRGIPMPTVRASGSSAARTSLDQARQFLLDHHIPAAANYTRAAFELTLKSFCERFDVPVAFKVDSRHLDTGRLLSAVEGWFKSHSARVCIAGVFERIKLFRKVVLNPYSHASPPNIAQAEVEGAISAVDQLLAVIGAGGSEGNAVVAARSLIASSSPTSGDLYAALGYLRVAFAGSLRAFCRRKHVVFTFREQAIDVETLWQAVFGDQTALFQPPHDSVAAQLDAERRWLITPITEPTLSAITQADLNRLLTLLVPAGSDSMILDSI